MPGVRGRGPPQPGHPRRRRAASVCDRLGQEILAEGAKLGLKEGGFKPLLKESKSGTYAPTFRQKITISEETGRSGCKFFDEGKRRLSPGETWSLTVSRRCLAYM